MLSKKLIFLFAFLFLIFIIELLTDFGEIVVGEILEKTNPLRPKTGTIWEKNKRDQLAELNLQDIINEPEEDKIELPEIDNIYKLKTALQERSDVILSADQFLKIYNQLSPTVAQEIISFLDLLRTLNTNRWVWTKINRDESTLSIYFLDADYQVLTDQYPSSSIFDNIRVTLDFNQSSLESSPNFSKRIITPVQFFTAYNNLPDRTKLDLINNPFQLIRWYKNLKSVAISRYASNQTVSIVFEIDDGSQTKTQPFQAREIAVEYLIMNLNSLYPDLNLEMPERL